MQVNLIPGSRKRWFLHLPSLYQTRIFLELELVQSERMHTHPSCIAQEAEWWIIATVRLPCVIGEPGKWNKVKYWRKYILHVYVY
jgi:hypothetical protein